jgi:hypothetical protein
LRREWNGTTFLRNPRGYPDDVINNEYRSDCVYVLNDGIQQQRE